MDDFLVDVQEEDVAGKIAWYNQQLVVVKDDFIRWLGELGYTVDALEKPVTIYQGPCERYDSVEYQLTLHGDGELDGKKLRLLPRGAWWVGSLGMIQLFGRFGDEMIGFFQKDGVLSNAPDAPDYGYVTEDAWYWEKRGIDEHPARLSRDTVAELVEYVS
ncbi:MAG: hypothetical protein LBU17_01855 [Treponema sp.]|jgi:hypothetical protein|nr:hypothetical protein [Treponema sp.]